MQTIFNTYLSLFEEMDEVIQRFKSSYGKTLRCREGCDECCIPFTLSPIEAAFVKAAFDNLTEEKKHVVIQQLVEQNERCPLLIQQKCSIYQSRPLICRTHGLPIAYINDELESIEVSACPVNFPAEVNFEREGLLFMDPFNAKLAEINQKYADDNGIRKIERLSVHEIISGETLE